MAPRSGAVRNLAERAEIERQVAVAIALSDARDAEARAAGLAWVHAQTIVLAVPRSAFEAAGSRINREFQTVCRTEHSNVASLRDTLNRLHPAKGFWAYSRHRQCVEALIAEIAGRFQADNNLEHAVIRGRIGDYAAWLPAPIEGGC